MRREPTGLDYSGNRTATGLDYSTHQPLDWFIPFSDALNSGQNGVGWGTHIAIIGSCPALNFRFPNHEHSF